ncbi:hypothetical protein WA538_003807 [Blastocystis sp. DL]
MGSEKRPSTATERQEKRRKRFEENERIIQRSRIIEEANKLKEIPESLFQKHFSPLSSEFDVSKILIHGMKGDAALEVYELGRRNMETLYNACPWKWNAKAELAECRSRKMRFVTVRHRASNTLAAYLEVKMMNDPDDDSLVLYIYSIQVDESFQNRGLGRVLMAFAADLASYCHLEKCRLTVFKVWARFSSSLAQSPSLAVLQGCV